MLRAVQLFIFAPVARPPASIPPTSMAELFIGTLSGTSMDGIDAALVRFSPEPVLVASHSLQFPEELRAELLALAVPGDNEIDRLGSADVRLGRLFAQAVNELLASRKNLLPERSQFANSAIKSRRDFLRPRRLDASSG